MQTRPLGPSGLSIAPLVFGGNVLGWTADRDASFRVLDAFLDHGFDAIDTADVYSRWAPGNAGGESETMLGEWLRARPGARARVKIFTKVGSDLGGEGEKGLSARWIAEACERSLGRLGIEAVDLYFSHWPDPTVTHEETLGAYDALLKAGKIRAIGASNYDAALLTAALEASASAGLPAYGVIQPEYNLFDRAGFEGPLQDLCVAKGIGVVTYFSLASGFLSGKYASAEDIKGASRERLLGKYMTERGFALIAVLREVAEAHGASPAEVALAWLMARPGVTAPIASATSVEQVTGFARAAALTLSEEEMARLAEA